MRLFASVHLSHMSSSRVGHILLLSLAVIFFGGVGRTQTPKPEVPVDQKIEVEIVYGSKKSSIRIVRRNESYTMTETMTGKKVFNRDLDAEAIKLFEQEFAKLPKSEDVGRCRRSKIELRVTNIGSVKNAEVVGCVHDSSKSATQFDRMLTLLEAMHL